PFDRPHPAAMAAAVLLHDPAPPVQAGRELGGLLIAMLAKDPAARPTADQVRLALERLLSPGHAPAPPSRRRAWWLAPVLPCAAGAPRPRAARRRPGRRRPPAWRPAWWRGAGLGGWRAGPGAARPRAGPRPAGSLRGGVPPRPAAERDDGR